MTDLKQKLTEAKSALQANLTQYDELRQLIVMQQGAVQMLEELVEESSNKEEN